MTKNDKNLSYIEIDPRETAERTIIWLHGLGADGNDFVPIVPELRLPETLNIRFIFPHAPIIPVTLNNGYEMRAWFDIVSITAIDTSIDLERIKQSVGTVKTFIEKEESRGIPSQNVMLAGFSQGAVIALIAGMTYAKPLAGILALSSFLPDASRVIQMASEANHELPIFIAHGTQDTIVPYALGHATNLALQHAGFKTSWHAYQMPHSVCPQEINDIAQWIKGIWE